MTRLHQRTPLYVVMFASCAASFGCGSDTPPETLCSAPPLPLDGPPFVDATAAFGITTEHHMATEFCKLPDTIGGPGVCLFDFDGDDDLDIYFVDRAPHENRLYRNDGATFTDVSRATHAGVINDSMGCLSFDYDGDGDLDLYVSNNGPDQLLRNDAGVFVDVSDALGITAATDGFSVSATAGDIDGDGDLDLFVGRVVKLATCPDRCSVYPSSCEPEQNILLDNRPNGFVDVATERGIDHPAPTLATVFVDFDRDHDLDLYVGNDMGITYPDYFYENDGSGHFVDIAQKLGLDGVGTDTMGVDVGDFDLDGRSDMVITDFKDRPIRLFRCYDPARACSNEVAPEGLQYVKWAIGLVDFDNDLDLDLFTANGDVMIRTGDPNYLYFNDGNGTLQPYMPTDTDALGVKQLSRGAAFGDIDGDGDVDIVVANVGDKPQVLLNQSAAGHSLRVALDAQSAGAIVTIKSKTGTLTEHLMIGGSFAGSSDPVVHFGLGNACRADLTVTWLDGTSKTLKNVPAGRLSVMRP